MVTASILTSVADLSVAFLVGQKDRWDLCQFYEGLAMNSNDENFIVLPSNGYPAVIASNAQINAVENGCNVGIYNKIPIQDDPFFCPSGEEILGT